MVSSKYHARDAWTAYRDRPVGPPPAHPLWWRESATPAVTGRLGHIEAAVRDHPLHTAFGVEKVVRMLRLGCTETAL
eukprot:2089379-Pyramimonas_sp.AAC.1